MAICRRVDEKLIVGIILDVRRARATQSATIDEPMDSANLSTLLEANNDYGTSSEIPLCTDGIETVRDVDIVIFFVIILRLHRRQQ